MIYYLFIFLKSDLWNLNYLMETNTMKRIQIWLESGFNLILILFSVYQIFISLLYQFKKNKKHKQTV